MKRIIVLLIGIGFLFSCQNNKSGDEITTDIISNNETAGDSDKTGEPIIKFKHTDFNFGSVIEGEKVTHTYKFTNAGTKDLVLFEAKPS